MKRFLHKKWLSIPVIVVLVLAITAGGVLAAFNFMTIAVDVEVEEAMVIAIWPAWDNLEPYGSVDDVTIALSGSELEPVVSITTIPGYAGAGFVAGEAIVIPVNFRNAGDGELTLGALIAGNDGGLVVDYCWRTNTGAVTETLPDGRELARDFKDNDTWAPLKNWAATIAGNGGESGSAVVGAKVLFVRISAPGDIEAPAIYDLYVTFTRE